MRNVAKSYPSLPDFVSALRANYKAVRASAKEELQTEMSVVQGEIVQQFFSRSPNDSGQGLTRRSGVTANSFKPYLIDGGNSLEAGVQSFSIIPLYHINATEITPKSAKYLTIPAEKNLTASGRVRYATIDALEAGKGKPTWIFNRQKTGGVVGYPMSSRRAATRQTSWNSNTEQTPLDIYFYLTKKVQSKGRLSSFPAWSTQRMNTSARNVIQNIIQGVML